MGTIKCDDLDQFTATIARIVQQGLTFTADAGRLEITLSGGY